MFTDDMRPTSEGEVLQNNENHELVSYPTISCGIVSITQGYLVENAPLGPSCTLMEGNGLIFLLADSNRVDQCRRSSEMRERHQGYSHYQRTLG
jgi:hypothetical protein